jgi:hypothetical protein
MMPFSVAAAILSSQLMVVADGVPNLDEAPRCRSISSDKDCLTPEHTAREMLIEAWPQFAKVGSQARGETSLAARRLRRSLDRSRPSSVTDHVPYLNYGPTCRESTIRNCGDLQTDTCKFQLDTCNQNEELACKVLVKCWPSLTKQEKARCAVEATYAGMPKQIASYTVWLSCIQINYNANNFSPSKTFVPECSYQLDALQGVSCPASRTPSDTNPSRGPKRPRRVR